MAFTKLSLNSLTNLVVHEVEPNEGYARRNILLADSLKNVAVPMGRLAYRTKASGVLDQDAPYLLVATNADTDLVATNEFAVVFGDKYSAKDTFNTTDDTTTTTGAVAFVRGEVQLKADTIKVANTLANTTSEAKVKALLEAQGIILLDSSEAALATV